METLSIRDVKTQKNAAKPAIRVRQRDFMWGEYFLRRFGASVLTIGLGGVVLSVLSPVLVQWFLTKTQSGAEIMAQITEASMEDLFSRFESSPALAIAFALALWPLWLIFFVVQQATLFLAVLISINLLPWILFAILKQILMKKLVGEMGLKIKKNGLAKLYVIGTKVIAYPVILIIMLLLIVYFNITQGLMPNVSILVDGHFTAEGFLAVILYMNKQITYGILIYLLIISGINSYLQTLFVPPRKTKLSGSLQKILTSSSLGKDVEEEEIQVKETAEFYGDIDDDEEEEEQFEEEIEEEVEEIEEPSEASDGAPDEGDGDVPSEEPSRDEELIEYENEE